MFTLNRIRIGSWEWNYRQDPHLLIGGATGSGKSYLLYHLICQMVGAGTYVIIVDLKGTDYNDIRVITMHDVIRTMEDFNNILNDLVKMMNFRYENPGEYDDVFLVVDEFADVMLQPSYIKKEIFDKLQLLLQKARAAKIHVIIATQRPSHKVIPGDLKANLNVRVALRTISSVDSRVILDEKGAENLRPREAIVRDSFGKYNIRVPEINKDDDAMGGVRLRELQYGKFGKMFPHYRLNCFGQFIEAGRIASRAIYYNVPNPIKYVAKYVEGDDENVKNLISSNAFLHNKSLKLKKGEKPEFIGDPAEIPVLPDIYGLPVTKHPYEKSATKDLKTEAIHKKLDLIEEVEL